MCDTRCTRGRFGSLSAYHLRSDRGGRLASLRSLCPCFCGGFSMRKKSCAKICGAIRNICKKYAIASFHSSGSSYGAHSVSFAYRRSGHCWQHADRDPKRKVCFGSLCGPKRQAVRDVREVPKSGLMHRSIKYG